MKEQILRSAISLAKAGFIVFKLNGKVPPKGLRWRQHPYTLPNEVEELFRGWDGNFGVAPTKNQLIIDIDPRNFEEGDKPHLRLFNAANISMKSTKLPNPTVSTGGGGLHIYYNIPDIPEGMKIRKNNPKFQGIDFISNGSYAVGPGSTHPDTGKIYTLHNKSPDFDKISMAPDDLMELLLTKNSIELVKDLEICKDDDKAVIEKYRGYLKVTKPAMEGETGDARTYQVACVGRDFALSPDKTLEMMEMHFNPRCEPMWDHSDLMAKINNAYNYAKGSKGSNLIEYDFDRIDQQYETVDRVRWDMNGAIYKSTSNNIDNMFKPVPRFGGDENPLHKCLAYDEFSGEVLKTKWMPWDNTEGKKFPKSGVEWEEKDTKKLLLYLSTKRIFDPNKAKTLDVLVALADKNLIHPVKDYLRSLQWDGEDRLETWLINNSGAEDTIANRAISWVTIMQAVARIYQAGAKCDIITVFEGDQGIRKSTLVEILGGPWYGDIHIDPNNKDAAIGLRGRWFIEMCEMEITKKADITAFKRFISTATDDYRPPYATKNIKVKRQSVFIGTFNADALGQYINDPTGARRVYPLRLGSQTIDTDEIARIRDQIFAEAYHRITHGEKWHIEDPIVLKELEKLQTQVQQADGWVPLVRDWLAAQLSTKNIRPIDVYMGALNGLASNFRHHDQKRIANCLNELGCEKKTVRIDGKVVAGFVNPFYLSEELFG